VNRFESTRHFANAWRVFAGATSSALSAAATAEWADFETALTVNSAGPYFQVAALDTAGGELGRSDTVKATWLCFSGSGSFAVGQDQRCQGAIMAS
jgi:hypothetical protein